MAQIPFRLVSTDASDYGDMFRGHPVLSGHDSGVTELTDDAHRMIRTVLRAVQGMGDSAEEADPYVSTGQAAEIL